MNNPLKYTDPSGNIIPLLAVAIMGGMVNSFFGMVNASRYGNDMMLGAIGGFASGFVGAYVGGAVFSSLTTTLTPAVGVGFTNGFLSGAISGYASGFASGSLNAWFGGASFSDGFRAGFDGAIMGAAFGGVMGGLSMGINAAKNHGSFLTGKGMRWEDLSSLTPEEQQVMKTRTIKVDKGMELSNNYAEKFSKANFGTIRGRDGLYADGSVAPTGEYNAAPNHTIWKGDKLVNGTTYFNGHGYDVHLSSHLFEGAGSLKLTLGHEYMHIRINMGEGVKYYNNNKSHAIISEWEYNQVSVWNNVPQNTVSQYASIANSYSQFYDDVLYLKYAFPLTTGIIMP